MGSPVHKKNCVEDTNSVHQYEQLFSSMNYEEIEFLTEMVSARLPKGKYLPINMN